MDKWKQIKKSIPVPVFEARPSAIDAYWTGWKKTIQGIQSPTPHNGFVSDYLSVPFNGGGAIFAHDTAIMIMFAKYAFKSFRAIESLNNFYVKQHKTGEICREISITDGKDCWPNLDGDPMTVHLEDPWEKYNGDWSKVKSYKWHRPSAGKTPPAVCAIDAMTDHKFLWAELNNYKLTGDKKRLADVITPLVKLYRASQTYLQDSNGLYITDWAGMDNSPRNLMLGYGVDIASQMVYRARFIAEIYVILGEPEKAEPFLEEAEVLAELIRNKMWNSAANFFHDLTFDEKFIPVKTIAGFWPLFANVANKEQISALAEYLKDEKTFKTPVRVPSLARDEEKYSPWGEYYLGGVWPYTNAMIIEGLKNAGYIELATEIARNYWDAAVRIYEKTGTVWEYFAPEYIEPGRSQNPNDPGKNARKDFAGWGPYPLIACFLEQIIGINPDAEKNIITWNISELCRHGCLNYAFGDIILDLFVEQRQSEEQEPEIKIKTNKPFILKIVWNKYRRYKIIHPNP